MKQLSILLLVAFLSGCNLLPTRTVYEEYPVPVYKVPAPPQIDRPYLPIYDLNALDSNNTQKVIRAYVISVRLLLNYAEAQEEILKTYERLSESTPMEQNLLLTLTSGERRERDGPLSRLEYSGLLADAELRNQEATDNFNNILDRYQKNKEEIWRNFDEINPTP
jgi:hypothetical protein